MVLPGRDETGVPGWHNACSPRLTHIPAPAPHGSPGAPFPFRGALSLSPRPHLHRRDRSDLLERRGGEGDGYVRAHRCVSDWETTCNTGSSSTYPRLDAPPSRAQRAPPPTPFLFPGFVSNPYRLYAYCANTRGSEARGRAARSFSTCPREGSTANTDWSSRPPPARQTQEPCRHS